MMTPTGIQFIDSLRQEWSAGSITRDDALDRLLPWEDDAASRTQVELEAAWALRQEIEASTQVLPSQPQYAAGAKSVEATNGASSPPAPLLTEAAARRPDAEVQRSLSGLRANPLLTRDDLLAAHAICSRLTEAAMAADGEYIRVRCAEVERKVSRHIKAVHSAIEEACNALHNAPVIEEKLRACDRIREGLADIEALRSTEPTLPDMIAWCEQTRHELTTLLSERNLVIADVESLSSSPASSSEGLDTGLVESSKQRLIRLSDMQLSKDDIELRKAARDLTERLTTYLSSNLQPGTTLDKEALVEYSWALRLAKQAPEAIGADQAKIYSDKLASAQAELARTEQASEPPARAIPATPPPQPRSTSAISQPNLESIQDGSERDGIAQPDMRQGTTSPSLPSQALGASPPPPPPPRVQPGWGSTSAQSAQPTYGQATTGQQGPGTPPMNTLPPQHNTTANLPSHPNPYLNYQPMPIYGPNNRPAGLPAAAWAAIAAGVAVIAIFLIVIVVILAGKSGPATNNNPGNGNGGGGGPAPREVTLAFYQGLLAHDYEAAFNLLAPELGNRVDVNTLRGNTVILENREGDMQTIDVSNVSQTGNTAQATATVTYAGGNSLVDRVSLSKQGNSWLITGITGQQ